MATTELVVVLPGLAPLISSELNRSVIPEYLTKILHRSRFVADTTHFSRLLFNHFSRQKITGSDLPMTNLMTAGTSGLCIDPCYLHADRDKLLLFANELAISDQENAGLLAEIKPLFDTVAGQLMMHEGNQWVLTLPHEPNVYFTALPEVDGKAVEGFLPTGADRKQWLTLWNEIQMQLFDCEVNQQRMADNKLPINSVWFWGAGLFHGQQQRWRSVSGKGALLTTLAARTHHSIDAINDSFDYKAGQHLYVLPELDLESDWQTMIEVYDHQLFKPLWQQLARSKLTKLQLQIPQHGHYQLRTFDCWKFW